MKKKIAILQSNYIPWRGYFDIINSVDEFIIYDEVQFTKNDWRNRNKILTKNGVKWLTVPIFYQNLSQKIKDIKIQNNNWNIKHWKSILQNYSKSKNFHLYKKTFEKLFLNMDEKYLSDLNFKFIKEINQLLGIKTKLLFSHNIKKKKENRSERLVEICQERSAEIYISGPSAKKYLDEQIFISNNIKIEWINYDKYLNYNQLFKPSNYNVSILDLLFNEGDKANKFMKSFTK